MGYSGSRWRALLSLLLVLPLLFALSPPDSALAQVTCGPNATVTFSPLPGFTTTGSLTLASSGSNVYTVNGSLSGLPPGNGTLSFVTTTGTTLPLSFSAPAGTATFSGQTVSGTLLAGGYAHVLGPQNQLVAVGQLNCAGQTAAACTTTATVNITPQPGFSISGSLTLSVSGGSTTVTGSLASPAFGQPLSVFVPTTAGTPQVVSGTVSGNTVTFNQTVSGQPILNDQVLVLSPSPTPNQVGGQGIVSCTGTSPGTGCTTVTTVSMGSTGIGGNITGSLTLTPNTANNTTTVNGTLNGLVQGQQVTLTIPTTSGSQTINANAVGSVVTYNGNSIIGLPTPGGLIIAQISGISGTASQGTIPATCGSGSTGTCTVATAVNLTSVGSGVTGTLTLTPSGSTVTVNGTLFGILPGSSGSITVTGLTGSVPFSAPAAPGQAVPVNGTLSGPLNTGATVTVQATNAFGGALQTVATGTVTCGGTSTTVCPGGVPLGAALAPTGAAVGVAPVSGQITLAPSGTGVYTVTGSLIGLLPGQTASIFIPGATGTVTASAPVAPGAPATVSGSVSGTPTVGGLVTVSLTSPATGIVAQGPLTCGTAPLPGPLPPLPPPPPPGPLPLPPPPPPGPGLIPPPPLAGPSSVPPGVPVIPEADSAFLLAGGLAAIGLLAAIRATRRRGA